MLENLKEVILNLEKSLNMMVQNDEVELLKHPEYLEAMKEVVQSINQVTQTLKKLEESYGQEDGVSTRKAAETGRTEPANRILKVVPKKSKDRRASSN